MKILNKASKIACILLVLIIFILIVAFQSSCKTGCVLGVKRCVFSLMPSLFIFMIISNFTLEYNLFLPIERLFSKLFKSIFKLSSKGFLVILLSLIGGYPIGSVQIASLYKKNQLTLKEANRLLLFCISAGPSFTICVIGITFYNNINIGIVLYLAQIVVTLLLAFITRFDKSYFESEKKIIKNDYKRNFSLSLVNSVSSATSSLIGLFSYVIAFSIIFEILLSLKVFYFLANILQVFGLSYNQSLAVLQGLLEVTAGSEKSVSCGFNSIYFTAFIIGFSGFSVIMQVVSICNDFIISRVKLIAYRVINAILTLIITYCITLFFPIEQNSNLFASYVYTLSDVYTVDSQLFFYAIVFCSIVFIFSIENIFHKAKS